jgi:SulP family sulfate permease
VVYRYDSPLFFANAEDFRSRALVALDHAEGQPQWLVLNMEANVAIDLTALDALEDLRTELERRGVVLALARVKHDLAADLERGGIVAAVGAERIFPTLPTAVEAYVAWYVERHGVPPRGRPAAPA